jgi:cysteine-rich repeat protein
LYFPVLFAAACTDRVDVAGSTETEPSSSSSAGSEETGGPAETSAADTDTSGSSTTSDAEIGASSSESGEPVGACGNGLVEAGEACDDGNDIEGDGCSTGCLRSGSIDWSWTADEWMQALTVASDGTVFVGAFDMRAELAWVVRVSADGDELDREAIPLPSAPPGTVLQLHSLDLDTIDPDAPVYAAAVTFWDDGGSYVDGSGVLGRLGERAWQSPIDFAFLRIDASPGEDIVGIGGGSAFKYGPSGDELWRLDGLGGRDVLSTSTGGLTVLDRSLVRRYDADGSELWTLEIPEGHPSDSFDAFAPAPGDGVHVVQTMIVDPIRYDEIGRLWHVDAAGDVVSVDDWPGTAFVVATDAAGNLFMPTRRAAEETVAKYSPERDEIWQAPDPLSVRLLEVEPDGAPVAVLSDNTLVKLVP